MTTMTTSRHDYLQREFNDHPSLASLDDYEPSVRNSPAFEISSMASQHSGFRAHTRNASEPSDSDSTGPWSPPVWRRPASGWFQPADRFAAVQRKMSRESSPEYRRQDRYGSADHDINPVNVPLPGSPEKMTPDPTFKEEDENEQTPKSKFKRQDDLDTTISNEPQSHNNYIRFAVRAEVQQRTEPIEAIVTFTSSQYHRVTKSKTAFVSFISLIVLAISLVRGLFIPLDVVPGPDIIKVAGLARSFEPIIHYSESGNAQIGELQETGVAVWDLGESVRSSNMTSGPIIVRELDELSDSLKTLAIELTRFFANVDGDIDSILIVMEWAKRELAQVSGHLPGRMEAAYSNIHIYLRKVGGEPVASALTSLFGMPHSDLTKTTLQRTFNEFLNVLEESINTELTYSTTLFGLFEAIDRQFLNLQRTVIRETDSQETKEAATNMELAELWRKRIGSNRARIAKFEKNQRLLASIKEKTVQNKLTLIEHNGKLLALKSSLEILRKRLVSPLVRNNESSTLSVDEQIKGLDSTYEFLRIARQQQKSGMLERLYGHGRRAHITIGEEA